MRLSEIDDQFANQPVTLKHLFRVQVARVHEYVVYYNFLKDKYANIPKGFPEREFEVADFIKDNTKGLMSASDFEHMVSTQKAYLSPEEKIKILTKFNRMIKAKLNFQQSGGKYYNFTRLKRPRK